MQQKKGNNNALPVFYCFTIRDISGHQAAPQEIMNCKAPLLGLARSVY